MFFFFHNNQCILIFCFSREFVDSKTALGCYLLFFCWLSAFLMYAALCASSIGFFISLSFYVDAISQDLKRIFSKMEMNDEVVFESKRSSKSHSHKNISPGKLSEAILLHNELIKYLLIFFSLI